MRMPDLESINRAFSKQSGHYDDDDLKNNILQDLRKQVYDHVDRFISSESQILELNAGTGIDALRFVSRGHRVHATDLSDGMIARIQEKVIAYHLETNLTVQQVSYDQLDQLANREYDLIFSNFGGLNCIADLSVVARSLPRLLKPQGYITWVIMPPVCFWEMFGILKGNPKAFRRWNKNGVTAHLEGEHFKTWYHSLSKMKMALGERFKLIRSEGLAAISPPPHREDFTRKYPALYRVLRKADGAVRGHFPFNRWADHILVTFQSVS